MSEKTDSQSYDEQLDSLVNDLKASKKEYRKQMLDMRTPNDHVVDMMITHGELLAITAKQSHRDLKSLHDSVLKMNEGVSNLNTSITNLNSSITKVDEDVRKVEKSSKAVERLTYWVIVLTMALLYVAARQSLNFGESLLLAGVVIAVTIVVLRISLLSNREKKTPNPEHPLETPRD